MTKRRRNVLLVALVSLAVMVGAARATPVNVLDSTNFSWKYEMAVQPNNQNLDGFGGHDWWDAGSIPVSGGFAQGGTEGQYYRTDFGNSIWRANIGNNVNYTVEFSVQAKTGGSEGTAGTMGLYARTPQPAQGGFYFTVARSGQSYQPGAGGSLPLGAADNTDGQHVFRIARETVGADVNRIWVWRDGALLNPGAAPLVGDKKVVNSNILEIGDIWSSGHSGDYEIDYIRLQKGAYSPSPIPGPGPYAWYRADAGVDSDTGGTAAGDGDSVRLWKDQSGNGRHLDRISGTAPTLDTDGLNGMPVVRFSNDGGIWDDKASWGTPEQPNTIFIIARPNVRAGDYAFDSSSGSGRNTLFAGQSSNPDDWQMYAGSVLTSAPIEFGEYRLHTAVFNTTGSQHYIDGQLMAEGNVGTQSLDGFILGARYTATQRLDGAIAEAIVYDRLLSRDERQAVELYLAEKYRLAMIPEPATLTLGLLGAGAVLLRLRRRRAAS